MATHSNWINIISSVTTGDEVDAALDAAFQAVDDNADELDALSLEVDAVILAAETNEIAMNMQVLLGVNIDTLKTTGFYEVDTNLPLGEPFGELDVFQVVGADRIVQVFRSALNPVIYNREFVGVTWSAWSETKQSEFNKETEIKADLDSGRIDGLIVDVNVLEATDIVHRLDIDANAAAIAATALYQFNKVNGASTTSNVYSSLNSLSVANADAGTYQFTFNVMFTYNTTNRSAYFHLSDDGGSSWIEIRKEAKDNTDVHTLDYSFPMNHTGGDIDLLIEYRTEQSGDILNVLGCNLVIDRKI